MDVLLKVEETYNEKQKQYRQIDDIAFYYNKKEKTNVIVSLSFNYFKDYFLALIKKRE